MIYYKHTDGYLRFIVMCLALVLVITSQSGYAQNNQNSQNSQNYPEILVRGSLNDVYVRLVFDFPIEIPYEMEVQEQSIRLAFDAEFSPDFSGLPASVSAQIDQRSVSYDDGRTIIIVSLTVPRDVRHFRSGTFAVFDLYQMGQGAAGGAGRLVTANNARARGLISDQNMVDRPSESLVAEPFEAEPFEAEPVNEQQADTQLSDSNADENNIIRAAQDGTADVSVSDMGPVTAMEINNQENPDRSDKNILATVTNIDGGIAVNFPFTEDLSSAAFFRGGYLWLVFDKPYSFNSEGFVAAGNSLSERLRTLSVMDNPDALVMRMEARAQQSLIMEKRNFEWVLSLKDSPAKPRFPLRPVRRTDPSGVQQIFVAATDIGRKVEIEDPAAGDLITVLPMLSQGRGVSEKYTYATVEVLESAQGVAITSFTDDVYIERFTDGISITSEQDQQAPKSRNTASNAPDEFSGSVMRLIDFRTWRQGEEWEYRKYKSRIMYELSLQPLNDRNPARWKLARYYLAHGRASEALGMLELMLDEEPNLLNQGDYLAVRGIANYKLRRFLEAEKDLTHRTLHAEQDADLWLVQVYHAIGKFDQVLEHYRRGRDVIGTYDEDDKADIQIAVVSSALALGDLETALAELALVNGLILNEDHLNHALYLRARITQASGDADGALLHYDDLAQSPNREISTKARYARVISGISAGAINERDAIAQLERIRYSWRGDIFEVDLISHLSELYFNNNRHEAGLELLRQGITYFPNEARDRRMSARMGDVFRTLYLLGGADSMSPISAISLFYRFRELTPLGNEGDQMIRRLSDRLVSVDLLDRAAELLEYQVSSRLEGAARAQVAAKLAKIYILNDKPDKALEYLRVTREPILPVDILTERKHVESRALIELKRYEEAEVLIENDNSAKATQIKSDAYWYSQDWPRLIVANRLLLGNGWRTNQMLTDLQRLHLIRMTVALTFSEDRAGLIELRRRYGAVMEVGDFSNAFELLTNDQRLSGRELGVIASQIASVDKLQSYMRDYRNDFTDS